MHHGGRGRCRAARPAPKAGLPQALGCQGERGRAGEKHPYKLCCMSNFYEVAPGSAALVCQCLQRSSAPLQLQKKKKHTHPRSPRSEGAARLSGARRLASAALQHDPRCFKPASCQAANRPQNRPHTPSRAAAGLPPRQDSSPGPSRRERRPANRGTGPGHRVAPGELRSSLPCTRSQCRRRQIKVSSTFLDPVMIGNTGRTERSRSPRRVWKSHD